MAMSEVKQIIKEEKKYKKKTRNSVHCFYVDSAQVYTVHKNNLDAFIEKNGKPDFMEEA